MRIRRQARPPFSPEELAWLAEQHSLGASSKELAKHLNSTPEVIRVKLHQIGSTRPRRHTRLQHRRTPMNFTYEDKQELRRLYAHGAEFSELCHHFEISVMTLRRHLLRVGARRIYPRNPFELTARRVSEAPVVVYEMRCRGPLRLGSTPRSQHHQSRVSRVRMLQRRELSRTFVCPSLLPAVHLM